MYRQQFYIIANILILLDGLICIVTGYSAYMVSLELRTFELIMDWDHMIGCILVVMFVNNFGMANFGFYSEKRFRSYFLMIWNLFIITLLDMLLLSTGAMILGIQPFSRLFVGVYFTLLFSTFVAIRIVLYLYLDHRTLTAFNSRQILLVGTGDRIRVVLKALEGLPSWGHQVVGCLHIGGPCNPGKVKIRMLGGMEDFEQIIHERQIDEVIFAIPGNYPIDLKKYLGKCEEVGVAFRIVPGLFDASHPRLKVETLRDIPTLAAYSGIISASGLLYKKILDVIVGTVGFIIFLLLFPFVGFAVKMESTGPILFRQVRVGQNNRRFSLYKFRTMYEDAEARKEELLEKSEMNGPIFKIENDPRITSVGSFLRKTSLDEVPQFLNVLKGEMSVVGTRPPTPDEVEQYEDWHRRRISAKPGITGLWQVSGRNKITDFNEIVRLDLQYIDGWRFWKDLAIIFRTIWVVLVRKGAR